MVKVKRSYKVAVKAQKKKKKKSPLVFFENF